MPWIFKRNLHRSISKYIKLTDYTICVILCFNTASSCIPSPRLLCKPRLYELDLIRGNGKTVRVISRTSATWERVATRLHFEGYEIRSIRRDHHFQSGDACSTMLIEWLEGKGRHPTTWETLIEALEEADLSELANDLKDVFLV